MQNRPGTGNSVSMVPVSSPISYLPLQAKLLSKVQLQHTWIRNRSISIISISIATLLFVLCTPDISFAQRKKPVVIPPAPVKTKDTVVLNEGTVIRLRLQETLDSRTAEQGDFISFETVIPVLVNDKIVIQAGAKATGTVAEAGKSGMLKKAKLSFTLDYVTAVDGQNVPLSSPGINRGGKTIGNGGIVGAAVINPVFIVIPGKNITVKKGQEFNVYVGRTMSIVLNL